MRIKQIFNLFYSPKIKQKRIPNSRYNRDKYKILIRILHFILNTSINIFGNSIYNGNPAGSWIVLYRIKLQNASRQTNSYECIFLIRRHMKKHISD